MDWEQIAIGRPPGDEMRIPYVDPESLVAMGYYPSTGLPKGQSADYRRALPDGRGLHVRLYPGFATVHLDRVDPSVSLVGHLVRDAPFETLIGACAVVGLLGSLSS